MFKRGRDTESDANIRLEEILTFFSNEFPSAFPSEIPRCGLLSDNITYQPKEVYACCGNSIKKLSELTVIAHIKQCNNAGTRVSADGRTDMVDQKAFIAETVFDEISNILCIFDAVAVADENDEIGRASCRERV